MTDVEGAYRKHATELLNYLWRASGDRALSEDVLHDTFVRLAESQPDADNVRAWLYTVAANRLRDVARIEGRRAELRRESPPFVAGDPPPPVPARLARREARERLDRLLAGLPERDRHALLLREAGLTHREIAIVVGTTTGSVGTILARALRRVQKTLQSPEAGT